MEQILRNETQFSNRIPNQDDVHLSPVTIPLSFSYALLLLNPLAPRTEGFIWSWFWPTLSTDLIMGAMSAMCSSPIFLSQSSCCLVMF